MSIVRSYTRFGGWHPETAALGNTLAALGVRAPHTDAPLSEALLLGIGGGLEAGYILWEFKQHNARVVVLGFRNRWQYPVKYLQTLCDRVKAVATFVETAGRSTAARQLQEAIERGTPAIAWVDRALMPYLQLSATLEGHIGHMVCAYGLAESDVLIDDLAVKPFRVPAESFANAR